MPINHYCNDRLKALIEEFGEDAVKNAVDRSNLMRADDNVNKGLICHACVGFHDIYDVDIGHNTIDVIDCTRVRPKLQAAVGLQGSHASFRMARNIGLSVDDSVDNLGNFYIHARAGSSFIKPSDKDEDFKFSFFENVFSSSRLKNYLLLKKEKIEKYKELELEDFAGLWDNHLEEDSEWHTKPYNIFRKRKGLPEIALEVGEVYFINLGKGDESRIVKMRLQRIKNEDANFPELYFSLEDLRTMKHNATHMNIGIFKVINKVCKNAQNKN